MIELAAWARAAQLPEKPWLVLGKGPSFGRHVDFDLTWFNTLGLNHVVRELRVDVAHAIDVDVVVACADVLDSNCRWLVMPRNPHVDFRPSARRLEDFFDEIPVLRALDEDDRLVWYNLSNSSGPDSGFAGGRGPFLQRRSGIRSARSDRRRDPLARHRRRTSVQPGVQ